MIMFHFKQLICDPTRISSTGCTTIDLIQNYSNEDFQASLLSVDWNPVLLCDNVNKAWERFKHLFVSVIDNIAPVKQLRIKQRTEPWMDLDILQAIKDRDSSSNKYRINKTEEQLNTF